MSDNNYAGNLTSTYSNKIERLVIFSRKKLVYGKYAIKYISKCDEVERFNPTRAAKIGINQAFFSNLQKT